VLYHLSHTPKPFLILLFLDRVSVYAQAVLPHDPPIYASYIAGMAGMCYHVQVLLVGMGVSRTFCLGWPQTTFLPISTFQEARITDMSHHLVKDTS
jgi:hypothetical protein